MDSLRRAFSAPPWQLNSISEGLLFSLDTALTHDSYSNEAYMRGEDEPSNERLEFLGDAALELAVREYVFQETELREGGMTGFKQHLVSNRSLAELFDRRLSPLHPLIRVGEGQKREVNDSIKAGCFEALIGGLYLHLGMDAVNDVCQRILFQDQGIRSLHDTYMQPRGSALKDDLDG
jgi:ribonuclease-3